MKKILSLILPIAALLTVSASAVDTPVPLLSWTDEPSSTVTSVWTSDSAEGEEMQIVCKTDYLQSGFASAVSFPAVFTDTGGGSEYHFEAAASGLTPDTEYVYRVGRDGAWSDARYCKTPENGDSVTFVFMGDVQPDGSEEESYAKWGRLISGVYKAHPELDFAVLGGDIVNSGISQTQLDLFADNASSVFGSVPLFSTVGNHESNFPSGKPELFLDSFAFPKNGPDGFSEEFYSFDCGNVHMTVLNSWIFSGEQKLTDADLERISDWIRYDLASSTADWQIVVTHLPVYPVHSDKNADRMQKAWSGIFEEYGADLVLTGHQHVYSRSFPLTQGRIDYENGVTYIIGVSGDKFYDSADETLSERTAYGTAVCSLVRTYGDTMTVQTTDGDGNELDYFTVLQRGGKQTRLAYITELWQTAGSPQTEAESPFYDTDAPAFRWAYEKGYVIGCGDGTASPDSIITDWQISLIRERMEAAA